MIRLCGINMSAITVTEPDELNYKQRMEIHNQFHSDVENVKQELDKLQVAIRWDKRRIERLLRNIHVWSKENKK